MNVIDKKICELHPYKNNPRINDKAADMVAKSIEQYGFKVPLVITEDGEIICGHTRYKAAQILGLNEVPCIVADDLTPEQVKAFRLVDNRTAEIAEWDYEILTNEISALPDFEISEFGFEEMKIYPEESNDSGRKEIALAESISVVIPCENDEEAKYVYEKLVAEGYKCRISTL